MTIRPEVERQEQTYYSPRAIALRVPAEPESLQELRRTLRGFLADLPIDSYRLHAAQVAATEAATNAVQYAYPPGESGPVQLEADFELGSVEIIVRDHGGGMRPGSSEQLGVGLKLIAALSDDFSISESDRGGVEVWMRFICS